MKSPELTVFQQNVEKLSGMVARLTEPCEVPPRPSKIFPVPGGEAQVWLLEERPSVSIAKSYITPNALFPFHTHDTKEVLTLFEGTAVYESGTVKRRMRPGDTIEVSPGMAHQMQAGDEGAWLSITTVPSEKGLGNV